MSHIKGSCGGKIALPTRSDLPRKRAWQEAKGGLDQQVTITLTRFNEPDDLVVKAVRAACSQTGVTGEVLFLEQKRGAALDFSTYEKPGWTVRTEPCPQKGLSHARNLSLGLATHDIVLFTDADACAQPGWAAALGRVLSEPSIAVAGSRILPEWGGRKPLIAASQVVRDQFSIYDLGIGRIDVPRVVGAGFGLRKSALPDEMYFDEQIGRRDGVLTSGEESDLCRRVRAAGGRVVYEGRAVTHHFIPPERLRTGWILKRLFYAGHGRARVGGRPSPSRAPRSHDWLYLPLILPPYALGWLWGKLGM